jgi:hypothetical protein
MHAKMLVSLMALASLSVCCVSDANPLHAIVAATVAKKPVPTPPARKPSRCPGIAYPTLPDGGGIVDVNTYPRFQLDQEDVVSLPQDPATEPGQANAFRMPFLHLEVASPCGRLTVRHVTVALLPAANATWTLGFPTEERPNGGNPMKSGFLSTMSWEADWNGNPMASLTGAAHLMGDGPGASIFWSFDIPAGRVDADDRMHKKEIFLFQMPPELVPPNVTFDLLVLDAGWTDEESGTQVDDDRSMDIASTIMMAD